MYGKGDMMNSRVPSFFPALPRERQQGGGRGVQGAHKVRRVVRCVLEQIVRDSFEIRGGLSGPPEFHQRRD